MVDAPTGLEDSTQGVKCRRLLGKAVFEEANRDAVFNVSSQRSAGVWAELAKNTKVVCFHRFLRYPHVYK